MNRQAIIYSEGGVVKAALVDSDAFEALHREELTDPGAIEQMVAVALDTIRYPVRP